MTASYVLAIAAKLIMLHSPDGADLAINTDEVVSMRGPRADSGDRLLTEDAKCLISTSDGKNIAVKETCKEVMRIFVDTERAP